MAISTVARADVSVCSAIRYRARTVTLINLRLPLHTSRGWIIPIDVMIDLQVLRNQHPVVTVAEYLWLHGLDPVLETGDGAWARETYHNTSGGIPRPSLFEVPNEVFDPPAVTRVDRLPKNHRSSAPEKNSSAEQLLQRLATKFPSWWYTFELSDVRSSLEDMKLPAWKGNEDMVEVLERYGLGLIYSFYGRSVSLISDDISHPRIRFIIAREIFASLLLTRLYKWLHFIR